jgi:release factor glutamine methyltransferase
MPEAQPWTIGRLLQWTISYLAQTGADTPRLDAEVLLAHAKRCRRIDLYTAYDEDPGDDVRACFRELVRRRAEGTPVAYLVGRREFYSLSFRVTPDVLIPRPETEFLVIALLDLAKARGAEAPLKIADVGTGCGVVAICAAKNLSQARVTALDVSPAALHVARANAEEHGVAERITLCESDLFAALEPQEQFDFIVSNPPYVTTAEMQQLPLDVARHEPHRALHGGESGLDVISRLAAESAERLLPGGWLLCEISPILKDAVTRLLHANAHWKPPEFVKDLAGHVRVVKARLA